jgi:adenosine deaminase
MEELQQIMNMMDLITAMPKVELHVHLEGAIRPETLLKLAHKHNIPLPYNTIEGLREWYRFTDFAHFVQIYITISNSIQTPEDLEQITREFLIGQAEQNILYSEVTYTPYTHYQQKGLPFQEQLHAINAARTWAERELGVRMNLITDIARETAPEKGEIVAQWAVEAMGNGVVALGLGGAEINNPPEKHVRAFEIAREAGLPSVPHGGETEGAESIWGALRSLNAVRIGHGVRCLEDPALVAELRERQIPLEVCPTSNISLKVFPEMSQHSLPRLMDEGLYVTINSDDPPMFNTTLTNEYRVVAETFGYSLDQLKTLVMNAAKATLLPTTEKAALVSEIEQQFAILSVD